MRRRPCAPCRPCWPAWDAAGIVGGVSYGTPVGNDAQFYKDIPVCPMTYGQAMAILMLAEALYHTGEDA